MTTRGDPGLLECATLSHRFFIDWIATSRASGLAFSRKLDLLARNDKNAESIFVNPPSFAIGGVAPEPPVYAPGANALGGINLPQTPTPPNGTTRRRGRSTRSSTHRTHNGQPNRKCGGRPTGPGTNPEQV